MEESFFGALQSWFKEGYGSDYGGRYIGLLIEHNFRADPRPFSKFLGEIFGKGFAEGGLTLEREHVFQPRKGARRVADLAVKKGNNVIALIELKYRDRLMAGGDVKPAQLHDYLEYCRKAHCRFLLMHRGPQAVADLDQIRDAKQCIAHYMALAPYLKNSSHHASTLLLDYFREGGLVLEPVDVDQLYRFLHRFLLPWKEGGHVVTSRIAEGPRQFQVLLNNLRLFAADITPIVIRATGKESQRAATIDFRVHEQLAKKRLNQRLKRDSKKRKSLWIDNSVRNGGFIDVWAHNAIAFDHSRWLYVIYGFEIWLEKGKSIYVDQYALLNSPEIQAAEVDDDEWDDRFGDYWPLGVRQFANPQKAEIDKGFIDLIRNAAKATLKSKVIKEKKALGWVRGLAAI